MHSTQSLLLAICDFIPNRLRDAYKKTSLIVISWHYDYHYLIIPDLMSGPGCRSASSTCRGFARDAFIQQQKCHDMSENIIQIFIVLIWT